MNLKEPKRSWPAQGLSIEPGPVLALVQARELHQLHPVSSGQCCLVLWVHGRRGSPQSSSVYSILFIVPDVWENKDRSSLDQRAWPWPCHLWPLTQCSLRVWIKEAGSFKKVSLKPNTQLCCLLAVLLRCYLVNYRKITIHETMSVWSPSEQCVRSSCVSTMVFVLLIAFHLSCSHWCTRPPGLIFLFIHIPFPDIREIINHLQNFQIHSFLDAMWRRRGTALVRFSFALFTVDLGLFLQ